MAGVGVGLRPGVPVVNPATDGCGPFDPPERVVVQLTFGDAPAVVLVVVQDGGPDVARIRPVMISCGSSLTVAARVLARCGRASRVAP